ncbi:hypothetical protein GGP41_008281 [Bipolaris sorokiniana]|uniref:Uncharacterized protein n=1 Tax=Cochliobolus sativus TaxID=45130 RepID=A0A8H6DYB7_COCSA|nr:hypothetical protein GGP41_008281 [Bipolaris sorokiniana]
MTLTQETGITFLGTFPELCCTYILLVGFTRASGATTYSFSLRITDSNIAGKHLIPTKQKASRMILNTIFIAIQTCKVCQPRYRQQQHKHHQLPIRAKYHLIILMVNTAWEFSFWSSA